MSKIYPNNKILNFPKGGKDLSLFEVDSCLSNHGVVRLLIHLVKDSTLIRCNQIHLNLDILKEPYRDFVWLFFQVVSRESTTTFPRYVIFVLYMTYYKNIDFDWGHVIAS